MKLSMFMENVESGILKGAEMASIDFQLQLSVRLQVVVKLLLSHPTFTTFFTFERCLVVIFVLVQKQENFLIEMFSTLITGEINNSVHVSVFAQLVCGVHLSVLCDCELSEIYSIVFPTLWDLRDVFTKKTLFFRILSK